VKNVDAQDVLAPASVAVVNPTNAPIAGIEEAVERLEALVADYIERAPLLRRRFG